MQALSPASPLPVILLNKARWGRGGGHGEGNPPLALAEGVPLPLNLNPQPISKVKREAAAQRRPARSERKNHAFSAKQQAAGFETQRVSP